MTTPREQIPTPDPTILTTKNLEREISGLRELLEAKIEAHGSEVELMRKEALAQQAAMRSEVAHLQALHEEKFRSIQTQFSERDTRGEQTSRDSKVAVDAALQAAKEAVGEQNKSSALAIAKSEAMTTKQIDQQAVLIETKTAGLRDVIDDLKARLTLSEGKGSGMASAWAIGMGVLGLGIGALGIIAAVVTRWH